MKKICRVVFIALAISCNNKTEVKFFETEGNVKNTTAKTIYLEENVPDGVPMIMDSAVINKDGSFALKSPFKEEALFQLRLQGMMTPFIKLISDVMKVKVSADFDYAEQPYIVTGSPASEALINFDNATYEKGIKLVALQNQIDSVRKLNAADSIVNSEYKNLEDSVSSLRSYVRDFISKSNSPVLILYTLSSFQNTTTNLSIVGFNQAELTSIVNAAATKFPAHSALQNLSKKFKAPDFMQPDVNGKPVSLSSFKGKYVLLDFWASWCHPCREENPNVVRAYNEFKDKNFTVLGVSLDQNQQAWVDAIQQDGLSWTHVNDINSEASNLYGVNEIPTNFLIDPQGNIIARNLRGDEIVNTLRQLIK